MSLCHKSSHLFLWQTNRTRLQFPKFIPEKRYFLLPDTKLNFDLKILIALIEDFFRRNALKWEHFLFHLCNCRHNKLRQCLLTGHALGIRICGCSLFYKRELWASKSAGAHSTKSLKISGCKRWYPKDLRVPAPAAPALTHSLILRLRVLFYRTDCTRRS